MRPASLWTLAVAAALWLTAPSCASTDTCRYNSDCVDAYCSNGACKQDCVDATRDCPPGDICNQNAQCEASGDGGAPLDGGGGDAAGDGAAPDGGASPDGATSNDGSMPSDSGGGDTSAGPDSGVDSGSDSGTVGTDHEFDLCSSDSDCASPLVCREIVKGEATRCTRQCTSNANCMASTVCLAPSGTETICVWGDVGNPCTAASTCEFACLTSQQYCTVECSSGADCPNGYGCMGVGTPSTNVCVKAEAPCDASDTSACIAAAACDSSATLVVDSCTTTCNTAADCPQRAAPFAPWTCDSGGICRRPADVFGPLPNGATPAQYACNASSTVVNVCNDAQHIDFTQFTVPAPPAVSCSATMTTAGVAGDACVDSCTYQGGCPYGYACTALGDVSAMRIGLCLPALGPGEVGASCTTDGDCFFGYCNRATMLCTRDCTADGVCPTGSTCTAAGGPAVDGLPFRRCE